jgi:cold shock CspA family protein
LEARPPRRGWSVRLNGLDEGQKVTFEVVKEGGRKAVAILKLG